MICAPSIELTLIQTISLYDEVCKKSYTVQKLYFRLISNRKTRAICFYRKPRNMCVLLTEDCYVAAPAHEGVSRRCVLKHIPSSTVLAVAEAVFDDVLPTGDPGCSHTVFVFAGAGVFHPVSQHSSDFPSRKTDMRDVLVREVFFPVVAVFPPRHQTHSDYPPSGTVAAEILAGETFFPGRSVLDM